MNPDDIKVIVISGLSGSGKSTAVRAMEDLDYFCVDNLPVSMFQKFLEICQISSGHIRKAVLVMDVREGDFLKGFEYTIQSLREQGYIIELLFFDASDEVIVKRYSETRRRHPLAGFGTAIEGVYKERETLKEVRMMSDRIIDTSVTNVHQLREFMFEQYGESLKGDGMVITVMSFGYSHGVPFNADMVIDVRFLKNPFFSPALKNLTGMDEEVIDYVLSSSQTSEFLSYFIKLLEYLLPLYEREGKAYFTVAIGCTGGRHRSVVIANEVRRIIDRERNRVRVQHRDMDKVH